MTTVNKVAALKSLLRSMEAELFHDDMPENHKDVYYAAFLACDEDREVSLTDLQTHELVHHLSRPTFFRCLKVLVQRGMLEHIKHGRSTRYKVHSI